MTGKVRETQAMIAGMSPMLDEAEYIFCTANAPSLPDQAKHVALAWMIEEEGTSLIIEADAARELGFDCSMKMKRITLGVFSALDGFGLTAAVAATLAEYDIACNMVAGFHHDHVRSEQGCGTCRCRSSRSPVFALGIAKSRYCRIIRNAVRM